MNRTFRYTVIFEQDEDGVFNASVPALRGCFSYGDTLEEAEANIKEAIEGYLESLIEVGDKIPVESEEEFTLKKPVEIQLAI